MRRAGTGALVAGSLLLATVRCASFGVESADASGRDAAAPAPPGDGPTGEPLACVPLAVLPGTVDFGELAPDENASALVGVTSATRAQIRTALVGGDGFTHAPLQAELDGQRPVTVTVTFAARSVGVHVAKLLLQQDGCVTEIPVQGIRSNAAFLVAPTAVALEGGCGASPEPGSINVRSTGPATQFSAIVKEGPFAIAPESGRIEAGGQVRLSVTHGPLPATPTTSRGQLSLHIEVEGAARNVPLTATAHGAVLSFDPDMIHAGGVSQLRNGGDAAVRVRLKSSTSAYRIYPETATVAPQGSTSVVVQRVSAAQGSDEFSAEVLEGSLCSAGTLRVK